METRVNLSRPDITQVEIDAVCEVLRSPNLSLGPKLPEFEQAQRIYVTVGIGCTGGRHRSVYLVEFLSKSLRAHFPEVLAQHRELK